MKKITVSAAALMLALLTLFSASGCRPKEKPSDEPIRSLIARFEKACHELDGEEIYDCFNPDITKAIDFAAGLVGVDAGELVGQLFQSLGGSEDSQEFLSTVTITVTAVSFNAKGDSAKADVIMTVPVDDAVRSCNSTITCVLRDERWYISEFRVPTLSDFS